MVVGSHRRCRGEVVESGYLAPQWREEAVSAALCGWSHPIES